METPFAELANCQIDFGMGLNQFLDESSEIIVRFSDSRRHQRVLRTVRDELISDKGTRLNHREHPFNRYTTVDKEDAIALRNLCNVIRGMFQERGDRDAVVSFFHSGGAYYDDLFELLDLYWEYMDTCLGLEDSDDDDESVSEDEQPI